MPVVAVFAETPHPTLPHKGGGEAEETTTLAVLAGAWLAYTGMAREADAP
jgi:hypothetical protein